MDIKKLKSMWENLAPGKEQIAIECDTVYAKIRFFQLKSPDSKKIFKIQIEDFQNLSDFEFSDFEPLKISSNFENNNCNIICQLNNDNYEDVFDYQIHHMVNSLCLITEPKDIICESEKLIQLWATYLLKRHKDQMSAIAQRGLFGELWFMKEKVMNYITPEKAINGYNGIDGKQDFQFKDNLFEVKTSISNNPQKINISNEKQLDVPEHLNLNLVFISMDKYKNNGTTLNKLVSELREIFSQNLSTNLKFDNLLLEYGFPIDNSIIYDEYGYEIRKCRFFEVKEDFPRIIRGDILEGVGGVSYTIDLSACRDYEISEKESLGVLDG